MGFPPRVRKGCVMSKDLLPPNRPPIVRFFLVGVAWLSSHRQSMQPMQAIASRHQPMQAIGWFLLAIDRQAENE